MIPSDLLCSPSELPTEGYVASADGVTEAWALCPWLACWRAVNLAMARIKSQIPSPTKGV